MQINAGSSLSVYDEEGIYEKLKSLDEQLRANKQLYNLPFTQIELMRLFTSFKDKHPLREHPRTTERRIKIFGHLENNDTKSATDECLGGHRFPPALRKVLLKAPLLSIPQVNFDRLRRAVDKIGEDNVRRFITLDDEKSIDWRVINEHTIMTALSEGFNMQHIKKSIGVISPKPSVYQGNKTREIRVLYDTIRMYRTIKGHYGVFDIPSNNVQKAHDLLIPLVNQYNYDQRMLKDESFRIRQERLAETDTSKIFEALVVEDIIIRPPNNPQELIVVGKEMHNCIAMYADELADEHVKIALGVSRKTNQYLACLEIRGHQLIQAVMKYNRPVRDDLTLNDVVLAFADQLGYDIVCSDVA